MSIKVFRYGNRIVVTNPANPAQQTAMVNVTFVEEGRRGANHQVSDTSAILDRLIADELGDGETTGLQQIRIHTQPIREDQIAKFPIGRELNGGFINRALYSTPQLRQQQGVRPRMIDGRPTFFTTTIEDVARDDKDNRISNDVLAQIHPEYFSEEVVSQSARVDVTERPEPGEQQAEMNQAMSNRPLANLQGYANGGADDLRDVDITL